MKKVSSDGELMIKGKCLGAFLMGNGNSYTKNFLVQTLDFYNSHWCLYQSKRTFLGKENAEVKRKVLTFLLTIKPVSSDEFFDSLECETNQ